MLAARSKRDQTDRGVLGKGGDLRLIVLWLRRLAVLLLGVLAVWFILFVFRVTDHRLSWIAALAISYALAVYVILPRAIRMSLKILQRRSVPSFTLTGDGRATPSTSC